MGYPLHNLGFFFLLVWGVQFWSVDGASPLTLAVFVTNVNNSDNTGAGRPFVEAVELAIELINSDTNILKDYNLGYDITDSQVINHINRFC